MYPMPVDGAGNPVVEPGQPETCPADACQAPPMDGACATAAPSMMPPEGGYDHAPMNDDFVMPEPFVMATPDPTGELSGAENIAPDPMPSAPASEGNPAMTTPEDFGGNNPNAEFVADGGPNDGYGANADALNDAFGSNNPNAEFVADAADANVANAMDSAMDQGGANNPNAEFVADGGPNDHYGEADGGNDDVDPSAGMG